MYMQHISMQQISINLHAANLLLCSKSLMQQMSYAANCMQLIGSTKSDSVNFHAANPLIPSMYLLKDESLADQFRCLEVILRDKSLGLDRLAIFRFSVRFRFSMFGFGSVRFANRKLLSVIG